MLTVDSAFTAEETSSVRTIRDNLQVAWKKYVTLGNRTFTIGVSSIGGTDVIGINPGALGGPGNFQYHDETSNVMGLAWERGLKMPTGGLSKGLAEAVLDNTTGRYTPDYMGGNSELFTAMLPRRPFIINSGFEVNGISSLVPSFSGITSKPPLTDIRGGRTRIVGADYTDYFYNRYLDQEVMFTALRTDEVMESMLSGSLGLATAQYELDYGINIIPFGLFESGTRYSNIFNELAEAENGQFYQDEEGVFRFENRQHWDSSPYTDVQKIIATAQVINAEAPDFDHIINVVEVKSKAVAKFPNQLIFTLSEPVAIVGSGNTELFVQFDDPILAIDTPTVWVANTLSDETGTSLTSSVSLKSISKFAKTAKLIFYNSNSNGGFITKLSINGRPAKEVSDIYWRSKDDSSVTAYEERPMIIENPYIQNISWAESYARMILNDFSDPENLQVLTIRAIPELQLGDLVSWQGKYWRIYDIKTKLLESEGFTQEITMLQRTVTSYFRIGISSIGGSDKIAP